MGLSAVHQGYGNSALRTTLRLVRASFGAVMGTISLQPMDSRSTPALTPIPARYCGLIAVTPIGHHFQLQSNTYASFAARVIALVSSALIRAVKPS